MRSTTLTLLAALTVFAAGCARKIEGTPAGPPIVPGSDEERLQGVWGIESFEAVDPRGGMQQAEMKNTRIQFRGNRMAVVENGRVSPSRLFALDATKDPKVLTLTESTSDEPNRRPMTAGKSADPMKAEWLYKFDGELLVMAVVEGQGERPAEFKPRAGRWEPNKPRVPAVAVVTLKKTDESFASEQPRRGGSSATAPYRGGTASTYPYGGSTYPYRGGSTYPYGGATYPYRGGSTAPYRGGATAPYSGSTYPYRGTGK